MSLLARLLALVLLTALPPLGLQVWRDADADREHRANIAAAARDLTLRSTVEQERIIDGARQLLGAIVSLRSVRMRDAGPCSASLRQIAAEFPAYAVISAVAVPDGEVFCSSGQPGTSVADRYWYKAALAQRAFTVGEQVTSRETGRRVLHFSRPALDQAGAVVAIVDAALDLDRLDATLQQAPLPPGAALVLADRKGAVLASLPDRSLVGGPLPEGLAHMLDRGTAGIAEVAWAGARRVTGYQPARARAGRGPVRRRRARPRPGAGGGRAPGSPGAARLRAGGACRARPRAMVRGALHPPAGCPAGGRRGALAGGRPLGQGRPGRPVRARPAGGRLDAMAAAGEAREAELRRGIARSEAEEARFRALFDAAPIAVMLVDPKTLKLAAFNDLACETLGYSREEFARLRLPDIDVVHPESAFRLLAAPRLPGRGTLETRFRNRAGALRDMLVTFEQVELGDQRLLYAASIDVTERRAAKSGSACCCARWTTAPAMPWPWCGRCCSFRHATSRRRNSPGPWMGGSPPWHGRMRCWRPSAGRARAWTGCWARSCRPLPGWSRRSACGSPARRCC